MQAPPGDDGDGGGRLHPATMATAAAVLPDARALINPIATSAGSGGMPVVADPEPPDGEASPLGLAAAELQASPQVATTFTSTTCVQVRNWREAERHESRWPCAVTMSSTSW